MNFLLQDHFNIIKVELNERFNQSLDNHLIDLLIIDVSDIMFDELNVLRLLKKMQPNLAIILLYDLKVAENIKDDLFHIADAMFRKPFNNQQVLNAVGSFVGKQAEAGMN